MDKGFFLTLDERSAAFAEREGAEDTQVELLLGTGRVYRLEKVVELTDQWFHADARDLGDLDRVVSLAVPYWQIHQVTFVQPRKKLRHAGFVNS